jgi:hypothetical protein
MIRGLRHLAWYFRLGWYRSGGEVAAAFKYLPMLFASAEAFVIGEKPECLRFSSNLTGLSSVFWTCLTWRRFGDPSIAGFYNSNERKT